MIIGLSGYRGSGKSTVAEYLSQKYGFVRINFKDALIAEIKEKFPELLQELSIIYNMSIDELFDKKPAAMRALMQNYGTNVCRAIDEDYWVKKWIASVNETNGKHVIADDVRFYNELAALGDLGGILIQVKRPDITTGGTHQSETEHEKFIADFCIEGVPGSHLEIFKQADIIMTELKNNVD